jgi:hypothetical protein
MDWAFKENERPCSKYYHKILNKVSPMGQSCGGIQSLGAAKDPRVTAVTILNSGILDTANRQTILDAIHTPIAYLIGGESDIAYTNSVSDYDQLKLRKDIPVWYGNYANIGHMAGYFTDDNAGEFARVAAAWLRWQLRGETGADAKGMFVGANCGLCNTEWKIEKVNMD